MEKIAVNPPDDLAEALRKQGVMVSLCSQGGVQNPWHWLIMLETDVIGEGEDTSFEGALEAAFGVLNRISDDMKQGQMPSVLDDASLFPTLAHVSSGNYLSVLWDSDFGWSWAEDNPTWTYVQRSENLPDIDAVVKDVAHKSALGQPWAAHE